MTKSGDNAIEINGQSRPMTHREIALWDLFDEIITEDIHGLWYKFGQFMQERGFARPYAGPDAEDAATEFAALHPEAIEAVGVDDDNFTSSSLFLFRHGTSDNYMGLSAVFIPQCTEQADQFFLYPGHQAQLQAALARLGPPDTDAGMEPAAAFTARQMRKPTAFDAIDEAWREKAWWLERLPMLLERAPELFTE